MRANIFDISLQEPIRWSAGDPLEATINRLLLLDAEPHDPTGFIGQEYTCIKCTDLVHNEERLRQVYGLLVLAHYRTTPGDLRLFLDAPNIHIYALQSGEEMVAVALIAEEGQLEPTLVQSIWEGKRRPKGQLLPQTLVAHEGWKEVALWKGWRIMQNCGASASARERDRDAVSFQDYGICRDREGGILGSELCLFFCSLKILVKKCLSSHSCWRSH